ncbi:MAG: cation:proton antiporter, partial [Elusimicrobia bacterium]|nr:cation:proton antiporter [Elusimicrobiota bacterium]
FGWGRTDSLFLGAILSISGSSVIAKVFMDLGLTQQRFAGAVFGLMISDDVAAMVMISLVSGLGAASAAGVPAALTPLLKIGFFVLLFLLAGLVLVPRILRAVARYQDPEMAGILTIGLCLGSAYLASSLGFSVALGAFLIGAIVASTSQAPALGEWMQPVRSMFSALFFVSAGMLVDPRLLWAYLGPVAAIAAATIVFRTGLGLFASLATGHRLDDSVKIGVSISQIGEFSFVIAGLGVSLGLASDFLYPTAVIVSSASMFFTPLLIARGDALAGRLAAALPGLEPRLERYRTKVLGLGAGRTAGGAIFGRYLVRLTAYVAVLAGLTLAYDRVSGVAQAAGPAWLWASRSVLAVAALPVSLLIAKYLSHVFLLLVTLVLALPAMSWIFRRVEIRRFYTVFHGVALAGLGAVVIAIVLPELGSPSAVALVAAGLALLAELLASRLSRVLEWIEERLDEAFGRATSEPTRFAILAMGDRRSLFYDLTEQLLLTEGAPAVGRSIEDLRIRAETGATIAAIYRDGEHLTNPTPDTVLRAHDLIVLLGEAPQRERARRLLAA